MRFIIMFVVSIMQFALCLFIYLYSNRIENINIQISGLKLNTLAQALPALTFVIYVAGTESWIWIMRLLVTLRRSAIVGVGRRYNLTPRPGATAAG